MRLEKVTVIALIAFARAEEQGGFGSFLKRGLAKAKVAAGAVINEIESAPYKVMETRDTYEVRSYPAQKWVCTSGVWEMDSDGNFVSAAADQSPRSAFFWRLFAYITGENERNQTIEMTAPVTMLWEPQEAENMKKVTMCFYVPSEHQEDVPAPTEADVFIQDRPSLKVIANRAGGFPSYAEWNSMAEQLKEDSMKNGDDDVDYSVRYTVGYDAPFKRRNRRNEVWYAREV